MGLRPARRGGVGPNAVGPRRRPRPAEDERQSREVWGRWWEGNFVLTYDNARAKLSRFARPAQAPRCYARSATTFAFARGDDTMSPNRRCHCSIADLISAAKRCKSYTLAMPVRLW